MILVIFHHYLTQYISQLYYTARVIILFTQGNFAKLYYLLRVILFLTILLRHANLSRLFIRIQHLSKLHTLVSSCHSKTSAHRSPSLAICTNSQDLSFFLESEHFSAKITRVPQTQNLKNLKNISLSLLYNSSFSNSLFLLHGRI